MKIVIVGAGAMGTLFGGRLARAGHQVVFVDTDNARIGAIAQQGVFENGVAALCEAALPSTLEGVADLLILFTKSLHTALAMKANAAALKPDGLVLTLQNGLGNGEAIAEVVGASRVLVGITNWPADLLDHGRIHVDGAGIVKLWSLTGEDSPALHTVSDALSDAGLSATAEPSVQQAIWEKVIFNAALNGIAALTGMAVGQIGDFGPVRELAMRIVTEGVVVAEAAGVTVEPDKVSASVEFAMEHHRGHKPSMLQDVEAGRPTEVDAIQGGLLKAAIQWGVAAPALETCAALLRGLDHRAAITRKC